MGAAGVGVLLAMPCEARGASACVRWLEERGAAAIVLFGEAGGLGSAESTRRPWIRADLGLERALTLAARYLHDLGHRRIGFVGEPGVVESVQWPPALSHLAGVKIDLQEFGDVKELAAARRVASQLAGLGGHAPTALICSSDLAAVMLLRALRIDGIDVPRQVSIIGVGDTGLAAAVALPSLTSVRVACDDAGATAARMALDLLEGRPSGQGSTGVKLVLRESTAPPIDVG
jgi:DNA-binding LacI/PurR family transcriptional regulator